jgi:flavodoxin
MQVLIVYGTQFGNTHKIARAIGAALEPNHKVRVVDAKEARTVSAEGIDLLVVGAPTQMNGLRLLVRAFTDALGPLGYTDVAAAAFDTRMGVDTDRNLQSKVIAGHLEDAGCRLVAPPESFLVTGLEGPIAAGELERAATWARSIAAAVPVLV